ncbi:MAG: YibE/F family protein [Eubacteriales bacterium]
MLTVLAAIFVILCLTIGGQRTAKSLISIFLNALTVLALIGAIFLGIHPLLSCFIFCAFVCLITLFYQNGYNPKTVCAFISIVIISIFMASLVSVFVNISAIQGFPLAQFEIQETNGYMKNVSLYMPAVQSVVILTVVLGSVIDTSICISSSLYEIRMRNKDFSTSELFWSGMNIGKNILSSTVNTLFFIYIAEYLTLFLQFANDYSFPDMINSKEFSQETSSVLFAAIASVAVIPVTSAICAYDCSKRC